MRLVIQTVEYKIITVSLVKNENTYVPSLELKKDEGQVTLQV